MAQVTFNGFKSKAEILRYIAESDHLSDINIASLLAKPESNPKLAKNGKLGVLAAPLHLAPFNLSGFQVCPQASDGCAAACLHTAGNPAYMAGKEKARIARTRLYFRDRPAFLALLAFEIQALESKAKRLGMQGAVRLNATSDLPFERRTVDVNGKPVLIMHHFSSVVFYDYTKITKRALAYCKGAMPQNYYLTFSKTENNDSDCKAVLNAGGNVAAVASLAIYKKAFSANLDCLTWDKLWNSDIVDGDSHDFRPVDPDRRGNTKGGCVVLLKAKGDARKDTSGFVIR